MTQLEPMNDRHDKELTMRRNAKLVFDSEGSASGVIIRSEVGGDRSVCFEYGRLCVDLVVHRDIDGLRVIHGQLFDHTSGSAVIAADVSMEGCEEQTVTDKYGEFALSTTAAERPSVILIDAVEDRFACAIPRVQLDQYPKPCGVDALIR